MKLYYILFTTIFLFFISCEDNSVNDTQEVSCVLTSETDSNNYLNRYFFDGENVDFVERYNSINAENPYRVINYRYNALGRLSAIDVFNDSNILVSTDSVYYSTLGFLKEVKRITGNGNPYQVERYSVNSSKDITKIEVFDIKENDESLKSTTHFTYDNLGRVIREELNLANSEYREVINYTYDDKKNPNTYNSPLLVFKKNNVVRKEQNFFLTDGSVNNKVVEYEYEYNEHRFPVLKREVTAEETEFENYYNYQCD